MDAERLRTFRLSWCKCGRSKPAHMDTPSQTVDRLIQKRDIKENAAKKNIVVRFVEIA